MFYSSRFINNAKKKIISLISLKILIIVLALFLANCNIFSPRETNNPEETNEWNIFFTTPELAIENLVLSYSIRQNISNYQEILTQNFLFYFDDHDIENFNSPEIINKNSEYNFLLQIYTFIPLKQSIDFILEVNTNEDVVLTNSAWIYRDYNITIPHTINNIPKVAKGKFEFFLSRNSNGLWQINYWKDKKISGENATLGQIKNEII